uniref:YfcL family protein n=1 Tax=Thaumasiovibrio occultus TaxID=1891184 RepID=UPI000B350641|nr:YfcL family protein [Thaumasiovibrio occultus]
MIELFEQELLEKIDNYVETASDDELFASGYLRGHISLCAADCEEQGIEGKTDFIRMINESLENAKNELSPADYIIVKRELDKLLIS